MTTWNDKHAVSCAHSVCLLFCLWKTTLRNHKNILPLATGSFGRWERFASEGARAHHVGMAWIFVPKVWLIYCTALSEESKEGSQQQQQQQQHHQHTRWSFAVNWVTNLVQIFGCSESSIPISHHLERL